MFIIITVPPLSASFIIMSLFFFKFKISCHSCFEIWDLFLKFSSEKLCFYKNLITDSKVQITFWGGQNVALFLTREESGVSNSGFSEKNSTSLSFLVKSLMSFSISGKLRCGVGVNFKPLLKIWICEGVKLTLDKFRTLGWIISSSFGWLSLHLGHEEINYLLRNISHFHQLGLDILHIWHNYGMFILLIKMNHWSRFRHNF